MKGVIIYKSIYGSTEQYAKWISEETKFNNMSFNKREMKMIHNSDVLIFGCPILAGRPVLANWIKKNWNRFKDKEIYLYTTSGAVSGDPELQNVFHSSFPEELRNKINYYPLSGRMIFKNLSVLDKILMKIGQKIEKDPVIKAEMIKDKDNVNRKEILSLAGAINKKSVIN